MNQERLATELSNRRPDYSDEVPRWAWGYINAATRLGIMQGFPDGTVGAGLPVTNVQSWAIMIRALGADGQPVSGQPALAGEALGVTRTAAEVQSVDTVQESVTLDHAVGDLGATLNLAAAFSMAGTPFPGDLVGRSAFVYLRGDEVIGLEVRP